MIDVQVAGAGAGKTYGLAEIILKRLRKTTGIQRKVFALTYTNTAKKEIELELIKQHGAIPDNLRVETVHSFLLNEIIFPFSVFVLDIPYKKSSITYLGSDVKFKSHKIKILKNQSIIHADKVYLVAKQIIDQNNAKNSTKKQKLKVDKVQEILNICIDSIFIDEVQDLDKDALTVFEILGKSKIFLHMTGDPKQAIKWPNDFSNFITKVKKNVDVNILPPINTTRRVPSCIVNHSNRFCYPDQLQKSKSSEVGAIMYIESTHNSFVKLMESHIHGKSLIYIDKKNSKYATQRKSNYCLPISIEDKIKKSNHKRDDDLVVRAAYTKFCDKVKTKGHKKAVYGLKNEYNIELEKKEYGEIFDLCKKLDATPSKFIIRSIDAVKGLEADTCLFILTPNTYKYYSQLNLKKEQYFNKEWKKLYVALTRTKKELILVLDHDLFSKSDIIKARARLKDLSVKEYVGIK